MNNLPIGVFDSGLGGLTVAKAIRKLLPHESIAYFGDTARLPYGTKSPATVYRFTRQCLQFLMGMRPKLLVVACNTASALALDKLRDDFPVPLIGVLEPGALAAVEATWPSVRSQGHEAKWQNSHASAAGGSGREVQALPSA